MTCLHLKNAEGKLVEGVFNVSLTHEKELPAILTWQALEGVKLTTPFVTLWMDDTCVFKGYVNPTPIEFSKGDVVWSAVALNEATFQHEKQRILNELEHSNILVGNIKGCVAGEAGRLVINPVTHAVSWMPLNLKLAEPAFKVSAVESLRLLPTQSVLAGVCADITWAQDKTLQGMMDVGHYITAQFPRGIETYSGPQLQAQIEKFAFKAIQFGYEVQSANLIKVDAPITADRLPALTLKDGDHSVVGVPYGKYTLDMQLAWYTHLHQKHTLSISFGDISHIDAFQLKVKNDVELTDDVEPILVAAKQWMRAYAMVQSLTHAATFKVQVYCKEHLEHLMLGNTCIIHDTRFTGRPLLGVVDKYSLSLVNGELWLSVQALIAVRDALNVDGDAVRQNEIDQINTPKQASDVVAYARTINDAAEQQAYYASVLHENLTDFWQNFPATQLEIGLNPPCGTASIYGTGTQQIKHEYTFQ